MGGDAGLDRSFGIARGSQRTKCVRVGQNLRARIGEPVRTQVDVTVEKTGEQAHIPEIHDLVSGRRIAGFASAYVQDLLAVNHNESVEGVSPSVDNSGVAEDRFHDEIHIIG